MDSDNNSITALYSAILFAIWPRLSPCIETNSSVGEYITQGVEEIFYVLRQAPSAKPMYVWRDIDICNIKSNQDKQW